MTIHYKRNDFRHYGNHSFRLSSGMTTLALKFFSRLNFLQSSLNPDEKRFSFCSFWLHLHTPFGVWTFFICKPSDLCSDGFCQLPVYSLVSYFQSQNICSSRDGTSQTSSASYKYENNCFISKVGAPLLWSKLSVTLIPFGPSHRPVHPHFSQKRQTSKVIFFHLFKKLETF